MIGTRLRIVFDVDDGPTTIEGSLALIGKGYRQDVRMTVSTSHRHKGMLETSEDKILTSFSQVKKVTEARHEGLEVLYGSELYYSSDILEKLERHQVPRMSDTRFALIEFSITTPWREIHITLSNVIMLEITPVVAHIERYSALEFNEECVKELINMGCYTQINSSHVLKPKLLGNKYRQFKRRIRYFLEKNLVHCAASDMHNLGPRPPFIDEAREIITKGFGPNRAYTLFERSPQILLENKDL